MDGQVKKAGKMIKTKKQYGGGTRATVRKNGRRELAGTKRTRLDKE